MKSIFSSSRSIPFVVIVKRNFLPYSSSLLLAYSTISFTTSQFMRGSPPKKSSSRFSLPTDFSKRKSMACFPTLSGISFLPVPKSPVDAKQYLQRRLQSCAIWRHIAFIGDSTFVSAKSP